MLNNTTNRDIGLRKSEIVMDLHERNPSSFDKQLDRVTLANTQIRIPADPSRGENHFVVSMSDSTEAEEMFLINEEGVLVVLPEGRRAEIIEEKAEGVAIRGLVLSLELGQKGFFETDRGKYLDLGLFGWEPEPSGYDAFRSFAEDFNKAAEIERQQRIATSEPFALSGSPATTIYAP